MLVSAVFNFFLKNQLVRLGRWKGYQPELKHTIPKTKQMRNIITVTALKILTGQSYESILKLGYLIQHPPKKKKKKKLIFWYSTDFSHQLELVQFFGSQMCKYFHLNNIFAPSFHISLAFKLSPKDTNMEKAMLLSCDVTTKVVVTQSLDLWTKEPNQFYHQPNK